MKTQKKATFNLLAWYLQKLSVNHSNGVEFSKDFMYSGLSMRLSWYHHDWKTNPKLYKHLIMSVNNYVKKNPNYNIIDLEQLVFELAEKF